MSILNLGVLNSIKNGVNSLISGVGKGTNSQTITLNPGVQTETNIFDVSDVNAIIAIKLSAVTAGNIECAVRYHDENGGISIPSEIFNFSAQSIYQQREIQLKASRVSFRLTNNGAVNKTLTLTLSKTALSNSALEKNISDEINVVSLFDASSLELPPLDQTITTKDFEFDSDYVRIGFYGLSGTFPANMQVTARYTAPSGAGEYVSFDPDVITEVKSGVNEGVLIKLKYRKVSFRFRNISAASFTLSRIIASKVSNDPMPYAVSPDKALYTREKQTQSLFSTDLVVLEPGDTTVFSDIVEVNGEYGVVGMTGIPGTPSTPIEIGVRYHGQTSEIIYIGDDILTDVAQVYTGKVAAVVPMIHKRVSFRIVNRGDTTITIKNVVISPRDTDPNGSSLINLPLSPDGAMYVQLKDEVDSAGYDAFFGSFKSIRTYKPDFELIVAPLTVKKNSETVSEQFSLQDGVSQLRIYLAIEVYGNPFPNTTDGAYLSIDFEEFGQTLVTQVLEGAKIKSGKMLYLLGSSTPTTSSIETYPELFGDNVKVDLKLAGTFDATNYISYKIISFQKFK